MGRSLWRPSNSFRTTSECSYDIDIGARAQAEAAGLRFARIKSLNTHPGLIAALAGVAQGAFETAPA